MPVLKVPFANTKEVVPFRGSLTGFLGTKATELFVVSTDLVIEVKKEQQDWSVQPSQGQRHLDLLSELHQSASRPYTNQQQPPASCPALCEA